MVGALVFISGPYSGDEEANTRRAIAAGELVARMGLYPVIPHLSHYWHAIYPRAYDWWIEYDLVLLSRCDAYLRLPGPSNGADIEERAARARGLPVFTSLAALAAATAHERVETPGLRAGANREKRVGYESVITLRREP